LIQTGVGVAELRLKVIVVADKGTKLLAYLSALGTGGIFCAISRIPLLILRGEIAVGGNQLSNTLLDLFP